MVEGSSPVAVTLGCHFEKSVFFLDLLSSTLFSTEDKCSTVINTMPFRI